MTGASMSDVNTADPEDRFVFFWDGFLSQWQPCVFEVDGVTYDCAEQYMMHRKALLFGDRAMADRILSAATPREQKLMGQRVQGFDSTVWEREREGIVFRGNLAKFSQNAGLQKKLLRTGDKTLVEASPHDIIWGIGLAADDPDALDPSKWRGRNLLGQVLMRVRSTIAGEEAAARRPAGKSPGDQRN